MIVRNACRRRASANRLRVESLETRRLLSATDFVRDVEIWDEVSQGSFVVRRVEYATPPEPEMGPELPPGFGLAAAAEGDESSRESIDAPDFSARQTTFSSATPGLDIVIQAGPNLVANGPALGAVQRAAEFWESQFLDPITIRLDLELDSVTIGGGAFPGSVLAVASSTANLLTFSDVLSRLKADASADEAIVQQLPDASGQLTFDSPTSEVRFLERDDVGFQEVASTTGDPILALTRPNALALGFDTTATASETQVGQMRDGAISFNNASSFDFDRSDGISSGHSDFEGVVIHEMGHALGMTSAVDFVDFFVDEAAPGTDTIFPSALDLFRIAPGQGGSFTTTPRIMNTGAAVSTQVIHDGQFDVTPFAGVPGVAGLQTGDIPMSTGDELGDGNQASHFKDDVITSVNIGILDPSQTLGAVSVVTPTDLRVLGLIGWDWVDNATNLTGEVPTVSVDPLNTADATPEITGSVSESDADVFVHLPGVHGTNEATWLIDGNSFNDDAFVLSNAATSTARIVRADLVLNKDQHGDEQVYFDSSNQDFEVVGAGAATVGLVSPEADNLNDRDVTDYSKVLTLTFSDFDPGESISWRIDMDQNTILGDDLIGSYVSVEFDNGISVSAALEAVTGNLDASEATLTADHYVPATVDGSGGWTVADNTIGPLSPGVYEVDVLAVDSSDAKVFDSTSNELSYFPDDFADAPSAAQSGFAADYPVTLLQDGARHASAGPTLGAFRDTEEDGIPTAVADGDDVAQSPDDEDGIIVGGTITASTVSSNLGRVTVDLQNPDSTSNRLDAWIDWNQNGSWQDPGEQIFADFDLGVAAGQQELTFTIPQDVGANVLPGNTFARFRLSTAGGLSTTGAAVDGEVEDHVVSVQSVTPSVEFALADQSVDESAGTVNVELQLSNALEVDVSVSFSLGGTAVSGATDDYTATSSPILISAGSNTATIQINVSDDADAEGSESIVITLGTPTNAILGTIGVHTLTIQDNDEPPTVEAVRVVGDDWNEFFLAEISSDGLGYVISPEPDPKVTLPWALADRIIVDFSEDVTGGQGSLSPTDFTLTGTSVSYGITSVQYDDQTFRATLILDAPLESDRFTFSVLASSVSDVDGLALDGDEDGEAGVDHVVEFDVSLADGVDSDGTGAVGLADLALLGSAWATSIIPGEPEFNAEQYDARMDLNGDGKISLVDLSILGSRWQESLL